MPSWRGAGEEGTCWCSVCILFAEGTGSPVLLGQLEKWLISKRIWAGKPIPVKVAVFPPGLWLLIPATSWPDFVRTLVGAVLGPCCSSLHKYAFKALSSSQAAASAQGASLPLQMLNASGGQPCAKCSGGTKFGMVGPSGSLWSMPAAATDKCSVVSDRQHSPRPPWSVVGADDSA